MGKSKKAFTFLSCHMAFFLFFLCLFFTGGEKWVFISAFQTTLTLVSNYVHQPFYTVVSSHSCFCVVGGRALPQPNWKSHVLLVVLRWIRELGAWRH